jgi:hypothetical protein
MFCSIVKKAFYLNAKLLILKVFSYLQYLLVKSIDSFKGAI